MSKPKSEEPLAPIRLTTAAIIDGIYFREGEALPFAHESDLPVNLRGLVATGAEPAPFHPSERDIYNPGLRRQARQVLGNVLWQDQAEAEASAETLPPETLAVLEEEHTHRIDKLKAQGAYNQKITDGGRGSRSEDKPVLREARWRVGKNSKRKT